MRVATVETGISLAENPSITFDYIATGATELTVTAKDTDDTVYPQAADQLGQLTCIIRRSRRCAGR